MGPSVGEIRVVKLPGIKRENEINSNGEKRREVESRRKNG